MRRCPRKPSPVRVGRCVRSPGWTGGWREGETCLRLRVTTALQTWSTQCVAAGQRDATQLQLRSISLPHFARSSQLAAMLRAPGAHLYRSKVHRIQRAASRSLRCDSAEAPGRSVTATHLTLLYTRRFLLPCAAAQVHSRLRVDGTADPSTGAGSIITSPSPSTTVRR